LKREARALESVRVFAGADEKARTLINNFLARTASKESSLKADIAGYYAGVHGAQPRPTALTPEERAAQRKVPANAATLAAYFDNRRKVPGRARGQLHGLMRDEVYNFVDGRRSYYDIYRAVFAESQAAGTWYYGTVTLKDVTSLLDAAVEAKALTLR
jgi:hypothetical protein